MTLSREDIRVLIGLSHTMSGISHVGAYFTASILPNGLHDAEIWGAVSLSTGKEPSLLAGCDNPISTDIRNAVDAFPVTKQVAIVSLQK